MAPFNRFIARERVLIDWIQFHTDHTVISNVSTHHDSPGGRGTHQFLEGTSQVDFQSTATSFFYIGGGVVACAFPLHTLWVANSYTVTWHYLAIIVTPHAWHVSLHVAAFAAQNFEAFRARRRTDSNLDIRRSNCSAVAALFTHERQALCHAISLCFESACQIKSAGPRARLPSTGISKKKRRWMPLGFSSFFSFRWLWHGTTWNYMPK